MWQEQIAEIALKANKWLTFSIVCGQIGLVLSVVSLVLLIYVIRKERK